MSGDPYKSQEANNLYECSQVALRNGEKVSGDKNGSVSRLILASAVYRVGAALIERLDALLGAERGGK